MSTHYRLLTQLDSCFDLLLTSVEHLIDLVEESDAPCWMLGAEDPADARQKLQQALKDFWYVDGQDGRVTRSYPGLIACNQEIWEQLGAVNYCKVGFSSCIDLIKREKPSELPEARLRIAQRHRRLHEHLTQEGLARLHLKQTWRQLPGCDTPLEQVRFSWYTSGRSIRRISHKEAQYRLEQMDTQAAHIQVQLKKLASLPLDEPLAQIQKQAPLMRANLFFKDQLPGLPARKAINLAMPLFILSPDGNLPPFNQPSATPPSERTRATRSDNKIEATPFLSSIRVHRYLSP